jgi:lipopolysaccharide heptosyltransferase I
LLIKPSALGDVIHTLPVLVKLRARYPRAQIDWLITPENADLVRHHPDLSQILLFPRRQFARFGRSWSATVGLLQLYQRLWQNRYQLVIDLHGQLRSALFVIASAAPVRIGFDRPLSRRRPQPGERVRLPEHGWTGTREGAWVTYSHRIPIPTLDVHAVDRYLWLGPLLGLDDRPPDFRIYLPPETQARVAGWLGEAGIGGRPLAVLAPGTTWHTKHWHVEGFSAVASALVREGHTVVLVGAGRDVGRCQAVRTACPECHDLSGRTTPGELAALITRAAVCVTNDSGPMHLAVALDRPVVSIFGPTNPVWIGPYGRPEAVVRSPVECAPCYYRRLSQCPHEHACMRQVSAAMVLERLQNLRRPA